jgi:hypothetical protein
MNRDDYDFAVWAQAMDQKIDRGLITSDGSEIDWHDKPLASLTSDELRAIFKTVRAAPDTGFEFINRAYQDAQQAVILELKRRGVTVHPQIRMVE